MAAISNTAIVILKIFLYVLTSNNFRARTPNNAQAAIHGKLIIEKSSEEMTIVAMSASFVM